MANWDALKAKLAGKQSDNKDSSDSKKMLWKPKTGLNNIRVIPYPCDDEGIPLNELVHKDLNPFVKLFIHSNEVAVFDGKQTVALKTFFKKDPISTFGAELYKEGTKTDNKQLIDKAKTMNLKERNLLVILDRDSEEDELTPYFWDFAKDTFELLLDEIDGTEFDNLSEGFDLVIKTKADTFKINGKEYPFNKVTKITLAKESSKACKKSEIIKLYDNFPNPFDMYNVLSYEELESKLEKYLSGTDDEDDDDDSVGETIASKPIMKPVTKKVIDDDDDDDDEIPTKKPVSKKIVIEDDEDEEFIPKASKKKVVVEDEDEEVVDIRVSKQPVSETVKTKITQKDFSELIKSKGKKLIEEDMEYGDDIVPF